MPETPRAEGVRFDRPPVDETVLGVDFSPLPAWNVIHYGLFYRTISEHYPQVVPQPPLPPQTEEFGSRPQPNVQFMLAMAPFDTRCWFIDRTETRLLQVQADRFLRNWRKRPQGGDYPLYPNT